MGGMPWRRGSRWLRRWERNAVMRSGGRPAWPTYREKEVVEGGRRQTGERGSGGDEAREAGRQEMSLDHRRRRLREQGVAGEEEEEGEEGEEVEGACGAACAEYWWCV